MKQEPEDEPDAAPSDAEKVAQSWHDQWHGQDAKLSKCWCCCRACKYANPHRSEAARAAVHDIEERIRESARNTKPPVYRRKR